MNVIIEAIKFNHDPDSATSDAFNIRRNETDVVHVPEWRRGVSVKPEDSPAAYARDELKGRIPTIRAKFSFLDFGASVTTIKIRAQDGHVTPRRDASEASRFLFELAKPALRDALLDNVLGSVAERDVRLTDGLTDGEEFELFNLENVRISSAGVSVSDIIWRWQFRTDSTDWADFATTTHRIFSVLDLPTAPWQQKPFDDSNTQQPWADVLDYACRWAALAKDVDEAATLVTRRVNELGQGLVHYDNPSSGNTSFTIDSPYSFDCTDFLRLLRGQTNQHGHGVNCDDCSAFVASFANLLGCRLSEAKMERSFPLRPHLRIGASALETNEFSYHTVAWSGACGEDDELFDACVQLHADEESANCPRPLFVPTNLRFGKPAERLYRFRLTSNPGKCNPVQGSALHRRIGFPKIHWEVAMRKLMAAPRQDRTSEETGTSSVFYSLLFDFVAGRNVPPPWLLEDLNFIDDTDSLISIQSFWRDPDDANVALQIDAHATVTEKTASDKISKLFSRFQLSDIKRQVDPEFGRILYTVPQKFVVLFARGSFVFRLRNVGKTVVSCENFARAIDAFLLRQLESNTTYGIRLP